MADAINVSTPSWQYHDRNIQGGVVNSNFTRADRVIVYAGVTPTDSTQSSAMSAVGLIQGMSHNEQKQLQRFFELGSSLPMIVPGLTEGQLSFQRVLLNGPNFINAIYHSPDPSKTTTQNILRSIRDVDTPFDLMIAKYPVLPNNGSDPFATVQAAETTLFRACQFQARSESITAGGIVIMEDVQIMYTYIPKITVSSS